MATSPLSALSIRRYLLNGCGYHKDCVKDDYEYETGHFVKLAAFAHRPLDARSACIAVIDSQPDQAHSQVMQCRYFGAPVVFVCLGHRFQVWSPGPSGVNQFGPTLTPQQTLRFFHEYKDDLAPRRIYDAKTLGRIPESGRQLDFVDVGLMPFAEGQIGKKLTEKVVDAVALLKRTYGQKGPTDSQAQWIVKSVFRLLAGKILQDKEVPKFKRLPRTDVGRLLERVQNHYGSDEPVSPGARRQREGLEQVAEMFFNLPSLRNLTTEALADVYERALVTKQTRGLLGTHSTPAYLVDYIVWQLAPLIAKIDPTELCVFEPACGHAPFLVAAMRLIRNLGLVPQGEDTSEFFRGVLRGIERDFFALEIARLSLTVADVPNPNGWSGLRSGDMFAEGAEALHGEAGRATLLLTNPPFEHSKALRVLRETIPCLRPGAVFGAVVPQALIYSPNPSTEQFREWLIRNCQLIDICAFPEGIFHFSKHESAILLGRRVDPRSVGANRLRFQKVREKDPKRFRDSYYVTTEYRVAQNRLLNAEQSSFWIPDLDEVWEWTSSMVKLASIARVGKGLDYKAKSKLPKGAITFCKNRPTRFSGFDKGFTSTVRLRRLSSTKTVREVVRTHELPEEFWLNLDPEVIAISRAGTAAEPQVLVNYGRVDFLGPWRLVAFVDQAGHSFTSRLLSIRPRTREYCLEYLWALCISPIANAFTYCHTMKRDNTQAIISGIPVPKTSERERARVTDAAKAYLAAAPGFDETADPAAPRLPGFDVTSEGSVDRGKLRSLLLAIDAEVLRLYDLPARAERQLLDSLSGYSRKGIPFEFTEYYPPGFENAVPLYAYLSRTYQCFLDRGSAEVSDEARFRYDALIDKRLESELSDDELDELHVLEAEMDGADYAAHPLDGGWIDTREVEGRGTDGKIDRIADELIDILHGEGRPDETHA